MTPNVHIISVLGLDPWIAQRGRLEASRRKAQLTKSRSTKWLSVQIYISFLFSWSLVGYWSRNQYHSLNEKIKRWHRPLTSDEDWWDFYENENVTPQNIQRSPLIFNHIYVIYNNSKQRIREFYLIFIQNLINLQVLLNKRNIMSSNYKMPFSNSFCLAIYNYILLVK